MSFFKIIIMGFGKMPTDCAGILLTNNVPVHGIWETEKSEFSPLEGLSARLNIPFERPSRKEATALLDSLREPAVVFSINNNYLFPSQICEKDNLRIINFHNALLPRYPGHGRVIPTWVIFNGESRHGVTWHLVNAGIDAGDILCQGEFAISENDTALKVMMRAISLGVDLFSRHFQEVIGHRCEGRPQGQVQRRVYRSRDIPNNGHIDISWDFLTMSRFLRSMDYGHFKLLPASKINLDGILYVVTGYRIIAKNTHINNNNNIQIAHSSEKNGNEARFFYREGMINLLLRREESYA